MKTQVLPITPESVALAAREEKLKANKGDA